ncbi:IniB N-terminal domain-containing protein [Goodfellowiella coeruleoviolacea]|uniref:Uncharacterized protein n=1 Tax=Goodfellowiella coeruleoviolacea TaxID=334858 RepID=A0AAE3GGQ0_9PSEU|nr:IniB N-terminal domain-containing protein [Goodfellowiella coeruleoviolacea]MCP2167034.1 hypothetical protein [Goodfellowiella coeruleoviolacea]
MNADQTLNDFVLNLLSDSAARSAFELDPEGALQDAGLGDISALDVQEVIPLVIDNLPVQDVVGLDALQLDLPLDALEAGPAGAISQLQFVTSQLSSLPTDLGATAAGALSVDAGGFAAGGAVDSPLGSLGLTATSATASTGPAPTAAPADFSAAGDLTGALDSVTGGVVGTDALGGVTDTVALDGVTGTVTGVAGTVTGALSGVTGGLPTGDLSGVTGVVDGVTDTVAGVTSGVGFNVLGGVTDALSGVTGTLSGLTGGLVDADLGENLGTSVTNLVALGGAGVDYTVDTTVAETDKTVHNLLTGHLDDQLTDTANALQANDLGAALPPADAAVHGATATLDAVAGEVNHVVDGLGLPADLPDLAPSATLGEVTGAVTDLAEPVTELGGQTVHGVVDSPVGDVVDGLSGPANALTSTVDSLTHSTVSDVLGTVDHVTDVVNPAQLDVSDLGIGL